jgi:hypothetical protein
MSSTSKSLGCLFASLVLGSGPQARASSFTIDAAMVGGSTLHLTPTLTEISPGVFTTSDHATQAGFFDLAWDLHLQGDPMITGSFTLTSLSSMTQTFSVSATLGGVAPIAGSSVISGSFGDVTYTDLNNDRIVRVIASPFYQAQIDGVGAQNLGNLNLGPLSGVAPKQSFGPAPGPGVATSIGVAFPGFSLTAGDEVQTPFEFVVVAPEPSTGPLLAMALAVLLVVVRRR